MDIPLRISISPDVEANDLPGLVEIGKQQVKKIVENIGFSASDTGQRLTIIDGTVILSKVIFGERIINIFPAPETEISSKKTLNKECYCDCGVSNCYAFNDKLGHLYDIMACQEDVPVKAYNEKLDVLATDLFNFNLSDQYSEEPEYICILQDYDEKPGNTHIELMEMSACECDSFRITSIEPFADDDIDTTAQQVG